MSVTIVTAPPTPTQTTAADSGSDASVALGFADLLSEQLALSDAQSGSDSVKLTADQVAAASESPDVAELLATLGFAALQDASSQEVTADAKLKDDKSKAPLLADAVPEDAASLLAAQGLASVPASPAPVVSETSSTADALSAVSNNAGQSPKFQETTSLNTASSPKTPAPADDDQAAKFAATLATAEEAIATKSDSADTATASISSLTNSISAHTGSAAQRDFSVSVATPVRDQNWATDLGQKVVWLANADKQSAQLTLNPPEMGPIEISLDVDKGPTSVSFTSANAEVRDALETALPKLREMFASAGIELGQTNVGAQSFSQQQAQHGAPNQSSSRGTGDNAILAAETTGTQQTGVLAAHQGNGMVDLFA